MNYPVVRVMWIQVAQEKTLVGLGGDHLRNHLRWYHPWRAVHPINVGLNPPYTPPYLHFLYNHHLQFKRNLVPPHPHHPSHTPLNWTRNNRLLQNGPCFQKLDQVDDYPLTHIVILLSSMSGCNVCTTNDVMLRCYVLT